MQIVWWMSFNTCQWALYMLLCMRVRGLEHMQLCTCTWSCPKYCIPVLTYLVLVIAVEGATMPDHLFVFVYFSLSLFLFISWFCISLSLSHSLCLSLTISFSLSLSLSLSLYACSSLPPSLSLSLCMRVYLSLPLSLSLYACSSLMFFLSLPLSTFSRHLQTWPLTFDGECFMF